MRNLLNRYLNSDRCVWLDVVLVVGVILALVVLIGELVQFAEKHP